VVIAARSAEPLQALADELGGPQHCLPVVCDVIEWEDQQQMVARALDHFGRIDVAFANAGHGSKRGFLEDSAERWRSMVLTNVYGAALTIRATLEALTATRGHVLLTGSVAGRQVVPGSLYSCTKFAVTAMGEALRQEVRGTGVRVTVVSPGYTDTPFFTRELEASALTSDDVARAVLFAVQQPPSVAVTELVIRSADEAL
jgi:NADP-dependent 3-hydroxy acid dehydrogenase YdfG